MARNVTVNTSALDKLARQLLLDAPAAVRASLRRAVREAGQLVAADAAPRTSPRVAATIKVTTSAATATISAGNDETPEAALLEGDGTPGTWRHPLFGNRNHWYEEARKPYLHPALDAQKQNATDLIVQNAANAVSASIEGGG